MAGNTDPIWHVSFRSGEASCELLYSVYLYLYLYIPNDNINVSLKNAATAMKVFRSLFLIRTSQQTPTPQILLTTSHHFSWHFTCRQLCFFFSLAKYPTSAFLSPTTLPHHLRTHPLLLPLPLIFQSLPLPLNSKSTRSWPTVQTSNLT